MAPSQPSATPSVFPVTMDIMDRAEALARNCFQNQGMETEAQAVTAVVQDLPVIVEPTSKEVPVAVKSKLPAWFFFHLIVRVLFLLAIPALAILVIVLLANEVSEASYASDVPPSPQELAVDAVRGLAVGLSTERAKSVVSSPVRDDRTERISPASVVAAQKLGQLSIIDRVGRPEIRWSGISKETCMAFVKDAYRYPDVSTVQTTVDGKAAGVSCDGPSHEVILSPHL